MKNSQEVEQFEDCSIPVSMPEFPKFKKLGLEDKKFIESFTKNHKPYSDYNFTNMWSWDTMDNRMISQLNGNLVVIFTDYRNQSPFVSFLGNYKNKETAQQLIKFAKESNLPTTLHFISEETATNLNTDTLFLVEEDENNFDYIFSVSDLANLEGNKLKKKRSLTRRFLRDYPDAYIELRDLSNVDIHRELNELINCWEKNKKSNNKTYEVKNEEIAINRMLNTSKSHNLILSCAYVKKQMVGFSIDEILPNDYAISHFIKGDINFRGVYEFINEKVSKYLEEEGVLLWNWEQDLNIDGLKKLKTSYRPINFLKKYKVSLKYSV